MPAPEQQIPEYLHQTLGVRTSPTPWAGASTLPAFLTARYRFAVMALTGQKLLLMVDESPDPQSPANIRKHAEQVRAKWDGPIVYVRDQVTPYNRKRLIEQRVPFIVPGNQMYLPDLGLDLREHFRSLAPPKPKFRPATQAMLIFLLLNRDDRGATASRLAPVLGYTAMTLGRAFDELESAELASTEMTGRERVLRFHDDPRATWERALPWLIDPVASRHFVTVRPGGLLAGLSALARSTMLAEPPLPVTAITRPQWRSFTKANPDSERPDQESAGFAVEVWKYEPREYDRPNAVDPLSLSLSVQPYGDERIEQALDALMEQVRW